MFWASIATVFGCVLFFSASKNYVVTQGTSYISQWQLVKICKLMGLVSICLSGVLWCSLHGFSQGIGYLAVCLVINGVLLYIVKPSVLRLITTSVLLIGCSFIYTTATMITDVI